MCRILCLFVFIGISFSLSFGQNVDQRSDNALELLSDNCRERAEKECITELTNNFKTTTERKQFCSYTRRQEVIRNCLVKIGCSSDEARMFREEICDFKKQRAVYAKMNSLTAGCRRSCMKCVNNDQDLKEAYFSEGFCNVYSSDDFQECVGEQEKCDEDNDEDVLEELEELTCGSAGSAPALASSLVGVVIAGCILGRSYI